MKTQFSADDEGLELFHEIFAVIGVNLQGDWLGEVEAEDAEDGFSVDDVPANTQVDVVGIAVGDVDEGLYVFRETEFDIDCFHGTFPHLLCGMLAASALP